MLISFALATCDYECLQSCKTSTSDQNLCSEKCQCAPNFFPTCSELCAYNCNKTFGVINESCLKSCECPCEDSCSAVCELYSLGKECKFSCGCSLDINHIKFEALIKPKNGCVKNCEMKKFNNTSELVDCIYECAVLENSVTQLGCAVQCDSTKDIDTFIQCMDQCIDKSDMSEKMICIYSENVNSKKN